MLSLAQNIWMDPKHFGTCGRTRHNSNLEYFFVPSKRFIILKSVKFTCTFVGSTMKGHYLFSYSKVMNIKYRENSGP